MVRWIFGLTCSVSTLSTVAGSAYVGVNFATGSMTTKLSNSDGIAVVKAWGVNTFKFFYPSTSQLSTLKSAVSNAEVVLGFTNTQFTKMASNYTYAYSLLKPFKSYDSIIKYVAMGNEVDNSASYTSSTLPTILLNASENAHTALTALGMSAKVVSPLTLGVLGWDTTPPSSAAFTSTWEPTVLPFLSFLNRTGSPFMINIYPYLSWVYHQTSYTLNYALADPSSTAYTDGSHTYHSLFDQNYDAVYYALKSAGYGNMTIVIGETGWPTGGADGATVNNACVFTNRIISQLTNSSRGTPARPRRRIPFYLFEAFDELGKTGSDTEPHYGLTYENGTNKFSVDFHNGSTSCPTSSPTLVPTKVPTIAPSKAPTTIPTVIPTKTPTVAPTRIPTRGPTTFPSKAPSSGPTTFPTRIPTSVPSALPTTPTVPTSTPSPTTGTTPAPTNRTPTTPQPTTASPAVTPAPTTFVALSDRKGGHSSAAGLRLTGSSVAAIHTCILVLTASTSLLAWFVGYVL